jgi:truncated hemoglobin YjbI
MQEQEITDDQERKSTYEHISEERREFIMKYVNSLADKLTNSTRKREMK